MTRRSRWPVVVAVLAVVALAGGVAVAVLGGGSHKVVTFAEAAAVTEKQHSARVEFTTTVPLASVAGKEILATGEFDFDQKVLRYDIDLTEVLKASVPNIPPEQAKATAISHGLTSYTRIPGLDQIPQLKGKWMKVDLVQQFAKFGVDQSKLGDIDSPGPASGLAKLRALSVPLETLGTEDVRGVKTTHYRATYDLAQFYRDRGAVTDEAAFAKMLGLYSTTTATTEAWIDSDGLVRRTLNVSSPKAGVQSFKIEFFDFGVKVNTSIPADADTFTVEQMQALAGTK